MLATVSSAALDRIEAYPVEVGVNAEHGDMPIVIVDLPDATVAHGPQVIPSELCH